VSNTQLLRRSDDKFVKCTLSRGQRVWLYDIMNDYAYVYVMTGTCAGASGWVPEEAIAPLGKCFSG
jgi:hypothetical protein